MNNLKRILTIALCSVLVVCTVPRFSLRSEAASASTYALYQTLLNLSGYLTTRGYSIVHEYGSSIPSITELQTMSYDNLGQRLFDISLKLNAFGATHDLPDLGDQFVKAMSDASFRGSIVLSKTVRELVDLYFYTNTLNGSVEIGTVTGSISDFYQDPGFLYNYGSSPQSSFYIDYESVPLSLSYSELNVNGVLAVVPSSLDDWSFNAAANVYEYSVTGSYQQAWRVYTFSLDNKTYRFRAEPYYVSTGNFTPFSMYSTSMSISDFVRLFYLGQYDVVDSGSLVTSQIDDTSSSDLLTSTNTIDSTGEVVGDTTIYLPDQATLESAIDSYNNQSITLDEFLQILGINSVASDATVQEKEDALTVVLTPTDDYLWFTKTQWGADSLEETRKASASTRAEEDSLADSIANTLNGGSDPEPDEDGKSRGKGLLALLLLGLGIWNTPIIAGDGTPDSGGTDDGSTDGSGDTSGYLQESIAGMAVAGGIVEDLFSAAGGSDGYGLAYTVGASFVIFSVIIGAANYFGALFSGSDTKQNIKSSGKQTRSKSPSPKSKKGG